MSSRAMVLVVSCMLALTLGCSGRVDDPSPATAAQPTAIAPAAPRALGPGAATLKRPSDIADPNDEGLPPSDEPPDIGGLAPADPTEL